MVSPPWIQRSLGYPPSLSPAFRTARRSVPTTKCFGAYSRVLYFIAGTNDSVTPALLELGRRFPDFPIYIVPGGQHGGPGDAGYTRRVTVQSGVVQNFDSFCRHHFFGARVLPKAPKILAVRIGSRLVFTTQFEKGSNSKQNELSWSFNRHQPYSLPF